MKAFGSYAGNIIAGVSITIVATLITGVVLGTTSGGNPNPKEPFTIVTPIHNTSTPLYGILT